MWNFEKLKSFFLIMFVLLLCGCKDNKDSKNFMQFEELKSGYSLKEGVSFIVRNNSKSNAFYYVGCQYKNSEEWLWGPSNIESGYFGKQGMPMKKIAPNETQVIRWPAKTTHKNYYPSVGTYRFVIHGACDSNKSYMNWLTPTATHATPNWQSVYSDKVEIK